MASDPNLQEISGDDKDVIASVRIGAEDEKMIRRAAVELDLTRSEFMAQASVERARLVLKRQRADDQRKAS
jgi:uncharacterized protein (DUF1778 family)